MAMAMAMVISACVRVRACAHIKRNASCVPKWPCKNRASVIFTGSCNSRAKAKPVGSCVRACACEGGGERACGRAKNMTTPSSYKN